MSCLFKEKRSDSKISWVPMIPSQDATPRNAEYISVNSLYIYGSLLNPFAKKPITKEMGD
jgi:hypothetical protein